MISALYVAFIVPGNSAAWAQQAPVFRQAPVFQRAMDAFQSGRNQAAIRLFTEAISSAPENVDAHYFLGLAYQRVGANRKAIVAFRAALKLDPAYHKADESLGLVLYRLKQYRAAERRFRKILRRNKSDATANFFTGLIRQTFKDHRGAVPYFRRATVSPTLAATAWFNLGLSYYNLGRLDAAGKSFETVLTLVNKGELVTGSRQYIGLIAGTARRDRRWSVEAEVGRERSNNVSRSENDQVTGATDQAWVFELSGDYSFLKSGKWTGTAGYALSQSIYDRNSAQNFQSHTGTLSFSYDFADFDAGLDYSFNHNTLDEKKFLRIHTVSPKISFFLRPTLYTILGYDFLIKDFFSDPDRDGFSHRVGASQFAFFAESKGYVMLALQHEWGNANAQQFDLQSIYINPVLQVPLAWAMTRAGWSGLAGLMPADAKARLGYSFRRNDYTKETVSIGEERLDKTARVSATLSSKVIGELSAEISFSHSDTASNLDSVVSTENIWGLNFSYEF